MTVTETFAVPARGIGHPDYTKDVSAGRVRPGLMLKANETMKTFTLTVAAEASPFAHVKAPLAPGDISHLVDFETGLDMPYTCPAGYVFALTSMSHSMSQDFSLKMYFDTFFMGYLGTKQGGLLDYIAEIVGITTALRDPTGAAAHLMDCVVVNNGGVDIEGSLSTFGILITLGTEPLPDIKTVKCKHCGHLETVPKETTEMICPACGGLTLYGDLSKFRGT